MGGVHFEGERLPVVAIADGTIIAYRYNRKYLEEKNGDKTYRYSNCYILIQHDYTTPKGLKLTFYSHYNNLSPWDELMTWITDNEQFPNIVVKQGYRINKEGLLLRSSAERKDGVHHNHVGSLKRGQDVIATPVNDHPEWAKKEDVNEYFYCRPNLAIAKSIVCEPQLDQIVSSCEIPIKAGAILGYTGLCEADGVPDYNAVHIEVFAGDDTEDFIKNVKKDGKPTLLKISTGKELQNRTKKYDISKLDKFSRGKGTIVEIEEQGDGEWVRVVDKKFVCTVSHDWLNDKYDTHLSHYTVKSSYVDQIKGKMPGVEIIGEDPSPEILSIETSATHLKRMKISGNNREISVDAGGAAKHYWVKQSELKHKNEFIKDNSDCYSNDPDAIAHTSAGKVPYNCVVDYKVWKGAMLGIMSN